MHRPAFVRALTGSWLLWFIATVVQSPATRLCPIHGGAHSTAGAHRAPVVAHTAHASHAVRDVAAADGGYTPDSTHDARCDCPDACRCGAQTLAPAILPATARACAAPPHGNPRGANAIAAAVRFDHVLPFANAPPRSPVADSPLT